MQNPLRTICRLGSTLLTRCARTLPVNITPAASMAALRPTEKYNKRNGRGWEFISNWDDKDTKISRWLAYNDKVYAPQDPSEPRRPAYVCHQLRRVKYSPKKMWYAAYFVQGMSVDEALKQLACQKYKGARIAERCIKEAQDLAVKEHDVEFRSNLWVAESFVTKGLTIKGLRRGAKGRITKIRYRHCNYNLRLEEGRAPPKKGHWTGEKLLDKWLKKIRARKITNSL